MDGFPAPKTKIWGGQNYSETRYAVIKWLEKELPQCQGSVLNIAAGNWSVPRQLLNFSKVKEYITCDIPGYGGDENRVDVFCSADDLLPSWSDKFDYILCNQSIECFPNPQKSVDEMYRVLKPGGIALVDGPFNYVWFGNNDGNKKYPVKDYWRFTQHGFEYLFRGFSKVYVEGFGGNGDTDRFVYCVKGVK